MIFCSGSCRLLNTISYKNDYNYNILHGLNNNHLFGYNFLGKLHDINAHIQFINLIKGNINMELSDLKNFLTIFNNNKWRPDEIDFSSLPNALNNLKNNIDNCDYYIFEICSIKSYKIKNYFCHFEQFENNIINPECETITLDEALLLEKINELIQLLPGKKIIFQCHFRPNIIFNDETKKILNREIIYETLLKCCNENVFLYDPSIILANNQNLLEDDLHFNDYGLQKSNEYIFKTFIK